MVNIEERPDGTRRVSISFSNDVPDEVSRTRQEHYKEADINRLVARYAKTGILGNPLDYRQGQYGDFSSGEDFAEKMRKVSDAQRVFSELPSAIRTRFANDPKQMIDFLVDPANDAEAIKLGLKVAPPPGPAVPPVSPIPPGNPDTQPKP